MCLGTVSAMSLPLQQVITASMRLTGSVRGTCECFGVGGGLNIADIDSTLSVRGFDYALDVLLPSAVLPACHVSSINGIWQISIAASHSQY